MWMSCCAPRDMRRRTTWARSTSAGCAGVLGDEARVHACVLRLRTAVSERYRGAGERLMFEDRLDPALRQFAAARTDLSSSVLGVVRDSLNLRRAEAARGVNTVGVEI